MQISDALTMQIQEIQHTANDTMTRVILCITETLGEAETESLLIVEPLSLEIMVDDD